ncbi:MAG: hypothetical protein QE487_15995 [Fluviicola sp.]|nr:hypothetical protein [Fluviicola sp.]
MGKSKKKRNNSKNEDLNSLQSKRTGGAINLRGIGFQLLYACHRSLLELTEASETKIQLEGLEDVDVVNVLGNEFVQLKTSVNPIDASGFWNMGVLKNFMDVFKLDPNAKFLLVHNAQISKGHLDDLIKAKPGADEFWKQKFLESSIDLEGIDFSQFLSAVNYKFYTEDELSKSIIHQLTERFQLNEGVQDRYLHALFYNILFWSKSSEIIDFTHLSQILQEVTDSFSKSIVNPAIQYNWIRSISFTAVSTSGEDGYFEGKAAKPHHIVQGLPVRRPTWEAQIEESANSFDVTVIKSSSGQGKSTLAWCAAQNLKAQGYSIYELQNCEDQSQIAGIFDFLCTRLKIGETPILVIDGLSAGVANWSKLIEQLQGIPVKVIVTTREEDWYRYGCDASKVRLQVINIYLSMEEAEEIFKQLQLKNKLSDSTSSWQPAWETIEEKKLLIEYVFLLTRGEMIAERITHQIKELNRMSRGAAAKLEILRLISLADILNIRISTQSLTEFIQSTVRFEEDRGEVYKQLENEYYLKFSEHYVEGLHPVRSRHLVDALHETISLNGSLVSLFQIIEQTDVFDFFANLAVDRNTEQIQGLYKSLAPILAKKSFIWKVKALDGLLFFDVHNYWKINQAAFNEVFETGSLDLFVMDMIPFKKLGILENLGNTLSGVEGNGFRDLNQRKENFSSFDLNTTEVWKFADSIEDQLPCDYESIQDYDSLNFLIGWFTVLGIPIKHKLPFVESIFRELISDTDFTKVSELSKYFIILQDQDYFTFCKKNKSEIFSLLKNITDSIVIEEMGEDILVKYLLENDEITTSNESSVSRIETIYSFLPFYSKYRSEAVILPFPTIDMYKLVLQNAEKAMPPENINNFFEIHLNQIWRKTILDKYRAASTFEWQEQIIKKRNYAFEFVKICTRYFEAIIENNSSRIKATAEPLIQSSSNFIDYSKLLKTYPEYKRTSIAESLTLELKKIDTWSSAITNFANQFVWLIKPQNDNSRNVAYRNFESALHEISNMQKGFDTILNLTTQYVNTDQINCDELEWYRRLFNALEYFIAVFTPSGNTAIIKNSRDSLLKWIDQRDFKRISQLHSIISSAESYLFFQEPNQLLEIDKNLHAIIGVDYLDLSDGNDLIEMSISLRGLSETEIDWFTFVNTKNGRAIGAFRCHRNYFERIKMSYEKDEEFDQGIYGNPISIELDKVPLDVLEGIFFEPLESQQETDAYITMMYDIWRLQQYRTYLNRQKPYEKQLLDKKETKLATNIKASLQELSSTLSEKKYKPICQTVTKFVENRQKISQEEVLSNITAWTQELNELLLSN